MQPRIFSENLKANAVRRKGDSDIVSVKGMLRRLDLIVDDNDGWISFLFLFC